MSEAVDLAALAARGVNHVTLERGVVGESGHGNDYTGWSDASSVFVSAKVGLRDQSRGVPQIVLTVEGSSNGTDWSTLATFPFGHDGEQSASFDSPPDHLRASWAVTGGSEWMVFYVNASASVVDAPAGGGGSQPGLAWRQVASFDMAALNPQDGTILDLDVLALDAWLADVYASQVGVGGLNPGNNGSRFSACGWDLAGNAGGPYYLHEQMAFNPGSWADLTFTAPATVGLPSLATVSPFLGSNISGDPVLSSPPVSVPFLLPTRVGSVIADATLPLQVLFADDDAVTYLQGTVDVWLLVQDPA